VNRLVWIDPDGFIGHDWMAVIVHARTGISYRHQYGGTACRHGTVEGYLVPVFHRAAYPRLRALFEETLRGAGTWNWAWPQDLLAELRVTAAMIGMPASTVTGTGTAAQTQPLVLDESRMGELDEAWVPVLCADGPAVLIWPNSD
jgi:Family of unknown function (DUF6210)